MLPDIKCPRPGDDVGGDCRHERGRDMLKEAVAQAPAVPDMPYHYAVALVKSGQRKEARSELERAFSLNGTFSYEAEAKKLLEQVKN